MLTLPLADVRAQLSKLVESATSTHERIDITRNGVRTAVLLSSDDYDSLLETLDILADADVVRSVQDSLADPASFTLDEVRDELRRLGRLTR